MKIVVGGVYSTRHDGDIVVLENLGNNKHIVQFVLTGNIRETFSSGIATGSTADKVSRNATKAEAKLQEQEARHLKKLAKQEESHKKEVERVNAGVAKAAQKEVSRQSRQAAEVADKKKREEADIARKEAKRLRDAEKDAARILRNQKKQDTLDEIAAFVGSYSKVLLNDFLQDGIFAKSIVTSSGQRCTRAYGTWAGIVQRCKEGGSFQTRFPHYLGTTICSLWEQDFQSFAQWYTSQSGYALGWDVDKDFLSDSKHYSPDTCILLPHRLNILLTDKQAKGAGLHYYVHRNGVERWRHVDGSRFYNYKDAVAHTCKVKTEALKNMRAEYEPLGVPSAVFDKIQCDIDSLASQEIS